MGRVPGWSAGVPRRSVHVPQWSARVPGQPVRVPQQSARVPGHLGRVPLRALNRAQLVGPMRLGSRVQGWVWLVADKASKKISLVKSGNADTPITGNAAVPLAVLDVWEHAYYLDYENRRADYATAVLDKLLNWRFVEENLAKL